MAKMLERSYDPYGIIERRMDAEAQYEAGQRFLEDNADEAVEYASDKALINELRNRGYKVEEAV